MYYIFYSTWLTGGLMGEDGKTWGLFTYGIMGPFALVFIHHIHVALNVRNWNVFYILIFIASLSMLPLCMWGA